MLARAALIVRSLSLLFRHSVSGELTRVTVRRSHFGPSAPCLLRSQYSPFVSPRVHTLVNSSYAPSCCLCWSVSSRSSAQLAARVPTRWVHTGCLPCSCACAECAAQPPARVCCRDHLCSARALAAAGQRVSSRSRAVLSRVLCRSRSSGCLPLSLCSVLGHLRASLASETGERDCVSRSRARR